MRRILLLLLTAAPLAGCGDDGGTPCVGHACKNPDDPINLPEGGEIRLELVHWLNRTPEVRTHAWFAKAQAPDLRPFTRPPANWAIQDGPDLCVDMRSGSYFPSGAVDSRAYMDVGDSVSFSSGGAEITLDKKLNAQDNAGYGVFHDILYINDIDPNALTPGGTYDFTVAGGPDLDAETFKGAMVLPPDNVITYPEIADHYLMRKDEDFLMVWDQKSTGPNDFAFFAIDDLYGPVGFCFGPRSGHMTIPAAFIESMPVAGNLLFGLVNHQAITRDDGRRMDFVGINCNEAKYVTDTSPAVP